jgi:hypothetical protein
VRPERFELPTYCSGGNRSIHLSYGRVEISLHPGVVAINRAGVDDGKSLDRTGPGLDSQFSSLDLSCVGTQPCRSRWEIVRSAVG